MCVCTYNMVFFLKIQPALSLFLPSSRSLCSGSLNVHVSNTKKSKPQHFLLFHWQELIDLVPVSAGLSSEQTRFYCLTCLMLQNDGLCLLCFQCIHKTLSSLFIQPSTTPLSMYIMIESMGMYKWSIMVSLSQVTHTPANSSILEIVSY